MNERKAIGGQPAKKAPRVKREGPVQTDLPLAAEPAEHKGRYRPKSN